MRQIYSKDLAPSHALQLGPAYRSATIPTRAVLDMRALGRPFRVIATSGAEEVTTAIARRAKLVWKSVVCSGDTTRSVCATKPQERILA